jgi:hypothetical protein
MQLRFASLAVVVTVALFACTSSTNGGSGSGFDAGAGFDGGVSKPDGGAPPPPPPAPPPPSDAGADADADADTVFTTVPPFDTGVDGTGAQLADDQIDAHWTVKDSGNVALTSYVKTDALGYPGYWMQPAASTKSKFITPFSDTVDPSGTGVFTYRTTFTLRTGVDLGAVTLVVKYASDNSVSDVRLNGNAAPSIVGGSYTTFETVTFTTGFVVGPNAVEIVVANQGGPTGLRSEIDLTAN